MDRNYKGVVWTDHALQRLQERGISQSDAWYVFRRPDQSRYAKSQNSWIYYKDLKDQRIEVVAKKEDSKWIIISVWSTAETKRGSKKQRSLLSRFIEFIRS